MACDPFIVYKTADEVAKSAMGALKTVDTKSLSGAMAAAQKNPSALSAMIPKGMSLPPGVNAADLMAKAKANPAMALANLPKGINPAMFANLLG